MTTKVKIEHLGPHYKDIIVYTKQRDSLGVWLTVSEKTVKVNESTEVYVYDSQMFEVKEDDN